jgi:hypothetical protein
MARDGTSFMQPLTGQPLIDKDGAGRFGRGAGVSRHQTVSHLAQSASISNLTVSQNPPPQTHLRMLVADA